MWEVLLRPDRIHWKPDTFYESGLARSHVRNAPAPRKVMSKLRMHGALRPLPLYRFMQCCLSKDNFTRHFVESVHHNCSAFLKKCKTVVNYER